MSPLLGSIPLYYLYNSSKRSSSNAFEAFTMVHVGYLLRLSAFCIRPVFVGHSLHHRSILHICTLAVMIE